VAGGRPFRHRARRSRTRVRGAGTRSRGPGAGGAGRPRRVVAIGPGDGGLQQMSGGGLRLVVRSREYTVHVIVYSTLCYRLCYYNIIMLD